MECSGGWCMESRWQMKDKIILSAKLPWLKPIRRSFGSAVLKRLECLVS